MFSRTARASNASNVSQINNGVRFNDKNEVFSQKSASLSQTRQVYNESSPSPTRHHGGFDQQTNDWRNNKVIESKSPFRNSPDMRAAGVTKSPVLSSKS
jgi:hypothetical protein